MRRTTVVVMVLLIAGCGSSVGSPGFSGERVVDTTTAAVEQEGYAAVLTPVDWLPLRTGGQQLEVIALKSGCSRFNGYRLRQTSSEVRLEVVNTALTPKGLPYACTAELGVAKHTIELPEPIGDARLVGGCGPESLAGEGRSCSRLRQSADLFERVGG